jgi:hypothetical protein
MVSTIAILLDHFLLKEPLFIYINILVHSFTLVSHHMSEEHELLALLFKRILTP